MGCSVSVGVCVHGHTVERERAAPPSYHQVIKEILD